MAEVQEFQRITTSTRITVGEDTERENYNPNLQTTERSERITV